MSASQTEPRHFSEVGGTKADASAPRSQIDLSDASLPPDSKWVGLIHGSLSAATNGNLREIAETL
jgi:hypothetical protein